MSGAGNNRAGEVFDWWSFREEIVKWMDRRQLSWYALYQMAGMEPTTGEKQAGFQKGTRPPSLYVACSLAALCDVSLDKFVVDRYEAMMAQVQQRREARVGFNGGWVKGKK
jgi:hypothetical protein